MDFKYVLIAYKMVNGFRTDEFIVDMSNDYVKLECLKNNKNLLRILTYREAGYVLAIYELSR